MSGVSSPKNPPPVRLLIIDSATADRPIDAPALAAAGIVTQIVEPQQLPTTTSVNCDVALLFALPGRDNLAVLSQLRTTAPASKTIIVTTGSGTEALTYLQAGATGLLSSTPDTNHLIEIIRRVGEGEYFLDQDIAQLLAMRQIKKLLDPFAALSSREFDVFCLLAEGFGLQDIARQLGISSKTVSNCQTQIKLKLGVDNQKAIKNHAKIHGLILHKGL